MKIVGYFVYKRIIPEINYNKFEILNILLFVINRFVPDTSKTALFFV
jgi:hypothetical protein